MAGAILRETMAVRYLGHTTWNNGC